eukprot:810121-Karenia_brevis.AAC.1
MHRKCIAMTSTNYWDGSRRCIRMTSKMNLDDFEDVQKKDQRRCSEEGSKKMFRRSVTKMFHGRSNTDVLKE